MSVNRHGDRSGVSLAWGSRSNESYQSLNRKVRLLTRGMGLVDGLQSGLLEGSHMETGDPLRSLSDICDRAAARTFRRMVNRRFSPQSLETMKDHLRSKKVTKWGFLVRSFFPPALVWGAGRNRNIEQLLSKISALQAAHEEFKSHTEVKTDLERLGFSIDAVVECLLAKSSAPSSERGADLEEAEEAGLKRFLPWIAKELVLNSDLESGQQEKYTRALLSGLALSGAIEAQRGRCGLGEDRLAPFRARAGAASRLMPSTTHRASSRGPRRRARPSIICGAKSKGRGGGCVNPSGFNSCPLSSALQLIRGSPLKEQLLSQSCSEGSLLSQLKESVQKLDRGENLTIEVQRDLMMALNDYCEGRGAEEIFKARDDSGTSWKQAAAVDVFGWLKYAITGDGDYQMMSRESRDGDDDGVASISVMSAAHEKRASHRSSSSPSALPAPVPSTASTAAHSLPEPASTLFLENPARIRAHAFPNRVNNRGIIYELKGAVIAKVSVAGNGAQQGSGHFVTVALEDGTWCGYDDDKATTTIFESHIPVVAYYQRVES